MEQENRRKKNLCQYTARDFAVAFVTGRYFFETSPVHSQSVEERQRGVGEVLPWSYT